MGQAFLIKGTQRLIDTTPEILLQAGPERTDLCVERPDAILNVFYLPPDTVDWDWLGCQRTKKGCPTSLYNYMSFTCNHSSVFRPGFRLDDLSEQPSSARSYGFRLKLPPDRLHWRYTYELRASQAGETAMNP